MDRRLLLPYLPAELRNLIYANTVSADNPATNLGLPFRSKTYDSSHTKVVIIPIHHGDPNLLALQKCHFLEADEYLSWLLTHATELRIGALFKGNVSTFVQEHWDKKMAAHLKNLVKKYAWLPKVTRYDIQIVWEPSVLVHNRRKRRVGAIAARMVETLTLAMDEKLKARRGCIRTGLHIASPIAWNYVDKGQKLGLADFITAGKGSFKSRAWEVRLAPDDLRVLPKHALPPHLKSVIKHGEDKAVLGEEKGLVRWGHCTTGQVIFTRLEGKDNGKVLMHKATDHQALGYSRSLQVHLVLAAECISTI